MKKNKVYSSRISKIRTQISLLFKDPGLFLADFLYVNIYQSNMGKIPYPILLYIIKYYGGWPGMGIILPMRKYKYQEKVKKFGEIIKIIIGLALIILISIFGVTRHSDSFFFGFVQELLAEIFFIIILLYVLPRFLNPPRKFSLSIYQKMPFGQTYFGDGKARIDIVLRNNGPEYLKNDEYQWELYIPYEMLDEDDIIKYDGACEVLDDYFGKMWKISSDNNPSLFTNHEKSLLSIQVDREYLTGEKPSSVGPLFKVYYLIRTINGNIPAFDKVTMDFMGVGIPAEIYPQLGEINFDDWIAAYQSKNLVKKSKK